jgi:hypothetical protein
MSILADPAKYQMKTPATPFKLERVALSSLIRKLLVVSKGHYLVPAN